MFIEAVRQQLANAAPIAQLGRSFLFFFVISVGWLTSSPGLPAKFARFHIACSVTVCRAATVLKQATQEC